MGRAPRAGDRPVRPPLEHRRAAGLAERLAQAVAGALEAALDRGPLRLRRPSDLLQREVGAVVERHRLALVVREGGEAAANRVAVIEAAGFVPLLLAAARCDTVERTRLSRPAAALISQHVQGNCVDPGLLAGPARVEAPAGLQDPLEGVRVDIAGELDVPGPILEKSQQ